METSVLATSTVAIFLFNLNCFWSIKNSSEGIEKLRLRNFQGSRVSSFDFSTLYTSLPHDLIKEEVLSLVKWCINRESKMYLRTSDKAGFFSNKKYDSYKCWTCTEFSEAFTFLMVNIYVQYGDMVYQQKLCSAYSRLIFILLREGFYVKPPEVQTVWPHRQIQRYLSISWRYIHHR